MQDLNISLVQSTLYWQDIDANLANFEEKIWGIAENPDLIILPEMFNTGFTMEAGKLREPMNSKTFRWMKQMAAQTSSILVGSYIVKDGQNYFNRLIWMEPDGLFATYDKRHLFRMAEEHHTFSAGSKILVKKINGWKICPLICYDLRFPVWSRNRKDDGDGLLYDVLIYIANWPKARGGAWEALLRARAVENLCYCAGGNRVGRDGNQIEYNGQSTVFDPKGEALVRLNEEEKITTIRLSWSMLESYRKKFPAHLDADKFSIT